MEIRDKKFHFIAIGGVGMSALSKYLKERGAFVSGSDVQESKYTNKLQDIGIKVTIGHNEENIQPEMIITASSAIKEDNPELKRAKELNLKIYHRSDILKMLSDEYAENSNKIFFGFSGTHGKTTTSGLASYILKKAGLNPSFVVGGIIPEVGTNGEYADGNYFIAELDESDGTIQKYKTDISIINNMEEDHLDYYKNGIADIQTVFNKFLSNNPTQKVIINNDNKNNKMFMSKYGQYNYITFGLNNAVYTAKEITMKDFGSSFKVYHNNIYESSIELTIPGEHNIYNALAVYAALKEGGVEAEKYLEYFKSFSGMGRRFQKVCKIGGTEIYDDYAHHPSEIKTTLEAAKIGCCGKNIIAIFQPHRYTRLKSLWNDFKSAFESCDKVYVTDVYSAGENSIEGITSEHFVNDLHQSKAEYIRGNMEECSKKIYPKLGENDIVITLGAGDITKLGGLLENEYKRNSH